VHGFTIPLIGDVKAAEGLELLGDRIGIMAGLHQSVGPMDDLGAVRRSIHHMIREAGSGGRFIVGLSGFPDRTREQTRFAVECCREAGETMSGETCT